MKPAHKSLVKISQETVEVTPVADDKKLLFTTSTCPNCRIAKQMLEGEEFKIIDAEQHPDLAQKYGIMQAPTLVVVSQGEATKYVNASNIQRYVENRC